LGGFQGGGGIRNFLLSEGEFTNAFDSLSLVDIVVGDLLLIDGRLESVQNSLNGIEGASSLKLVLDLQHDGHDVSSVREFQRIFGGVDSLGSD
jgi:hypothetical protein